MYMPDIAPISAMGATPLPGTPGSARWRAMRSRNSWQGSTPSAEAPSCSSTGRSCPSSSAPRSSWWTCLGWPHEMRRRRWACRPGRCAFGSTERAHDCERRMRTVASVEDRLWLELVEDHGAKLAETPWPSPKRHIRRTILIGGAALAVCGMVAALVVGLTSTSPPADAGSATASPVEDRQKRSRGGWTCSPRSPRRGSTTFSWLSPIQSGRGDCRRPRRPCRPRTCALRRSAQETAASICNDPGSISAYGAYLVLGPPHGPWNAWGYAPAGTTKVTVDGRSFPLYGRFYKAIVPPGLHYVVFTTPTGLKSYPGP